MNLFDLYENREPYQQAIDKLEARRIEDLEAKMDDYAHRGMKDEFQKCKAERDGYYKVKNTNVDEAGIGQDLVTPQQRVQGAKSQKQTPIQKVGSTVKHAANWLAGKGGPGREGPTYEGTDSQWSKESDWKAIPKAKSGRPADPRGEVTHLSDVARREAERNAAQKKNSEEVAEEDSRPRDLAAAVMLKKARAAFPIAQDDAEALAMWIAAKEQRDVDHLEHENEQEEEMIARIMDQLKKTGVDEEQKPAGWGEFPPKQEIKIDPPRKLKSGQTYQDQNKYWQSQGQAPIYKTNEAGSPAQQAAIAIAMKRAGKKPKSVDEAIPVIRGTQPTGAQYANQLAKIAMKLAKQRHADGLRNDAKDFNKAAKLFAAGDVDGGAEIIAYEMDTEPADEFYAYMEHYKIPTEIVFGVNEETTRLDPKCWTGKKIGTPKTKVKGGVRVNNCVPAEESYTGVMESQGITDPKLLEVARRIDRLAENFK